MLQMRPPSGEDRRWFNPERDMAYAMRRLIVKSLQAFDNTTSDKIPQTASMLGQLVRECVQGNITLEDLSARLKELDPEAIGHIGRAYLFATLGEFRVWCDEVRPIREGDAPMQDVNTELLDRVTEDFARASRIK
jgi:hypothetical protein